MISAPAGNVVQQFLGKITVRVDQTDPMPHGNVLNDHVTQEGGLSRAGFANDINVLAQIGNGNPEGNILSPSQAHADLNEILIHGCRFSRHSQPCCSFPGCGENLQLVKRCTGA